MKVRDLYLSTERSECKTKLCIAGKTLQTCPIRPGRVQTSLSRVGVSHGRREFIAQVAKLATTHSIGFDAIKLSR